MGVSSIGSYGFSSYTTPLNSGPTAGQPAQQAGQAQQAQQNQTTEETQETARQQSRENEKSENRGAVTATRGQNLNISV